MTRFSVMIDDPSLTFSALHCLTFTDKEGNVQIEKVHGHDFHVAITITGPLNQDRMVIDFVMARELLFKTIGNFNQTFFLPLENSLFQYREDDNNTEIIFCSEQEKIVSQLQSKENKENTEHKTNREERHWSFPNEDLCFLDTSNTTTEEIAFFVLSIYVKELVRRQPNKEVWNEFELELIMTEAPGTAVRVSSDILSIIDFLNDGKIIQ